MQFLVQGAWGVIPAHITELAPEGVRALLPGFAYQCGALLAGSIATLEATLAHGVGYARAMAVIASVVMVVCAVTASLGPERRGCPTERSEAYGISSSLPVVRRASRSRCAWAACGQGVAAADADV